MTSSKLAAVLVATLLPLLLLLEPTSAYSKYGRTCQDIGCSSNEVCVMQEDPCSIYSRNDCGRYPTCKRVNNDVRTCTNYVCPPSQTCRMDKGEPKCFEDPAATGSRENRVPVQNYNPGEPQSNNANAPSAPVLPGYSQPNPYNPQNYPQFPQVTPNSRLYPNIPPGISGGQTTSRPNVYQPGQQGGHGGYQGSAVGSGYPGSAVGSGYPGAYPPQQQPAGYPRYPQQSGGYPGYPQQSGSYPGYPQQSGSYPGYPQQSGGYPQQGSGGYPRQNGGYPGYPPTPRNPYQKTSNTGTGFFDKLGDTLKTIGTNLLKDAIKKL